MPNISFGVAQYSLLATSSSLVRGTLDTSGRSVAYIVSPTKPVYINPPATNPRIVIVEK
jgi:hypothetical protein